MGSVFAGNHLAVVKAQPMTSGADRMRQNARFIRRWAWAISLVITLIGAGLVLPVFTDPISWSNPDYAPPVVARDLCRGAHRGGNRPEDDLSGRALAPGYGLDFLG